MIKIWTDGSCLGNPGPGGWGFIAIDGAQTVEKSGGEPATTNNRMELMAVLSALSYATSQERAEIEIHTDSQYVKNGMQLWIKNWKRNGWKTADKKPVKNQDLWVQLDDSAAKIKINWFWVKGHSGEEINERVDDLARLAAEKQ